MVWRVDVDVDVGIGRVRTDLARKRNRTPTEQDGRMPGVSVWADSTEFLNRVDNKAMS